MEIRQDSDTPDLDVLIKSRGFVSAMSSRWQEYVIPDSLTERITEEFANRKTGDLFRQKATAIDLAYILDIARGLTLMGGELELTDRVLERACLMERVRFDRIEAMKKVAE